MQRLGIPVIASGFLGGSTGREIYQLLKAEKLKQHFIQIGESSRINITVSSNLDHHQTRLSFLGPKIKSSEKTELFDYIEKHNNISLIVLGGSLPPGFTSADVIRLIKLATKKNIDTVVDCPGSILSQVLKAKPLLIKPNLEEFQVMLGSNIKTIKSVVREAKSLLSMVRFICVSSVEGGAVLVTHQGCYFGKVPDLKVRSTVGAGDSMVGAMVAQLYNSND
ncbi:Tagatose-6-phosphate kinase [compost metagenome]